MGESNGYPAKGQGARCLLNFRSVDDDFENIFIQVIMTSSANAQFQTVFGTESEFYRLERLRYVEGDPVVVVTTYVPKSLAPGLDSHDFTKDPLYNVLQAPYGLHIHSATRMIEAVDAAWSDAEYLEIPRGSAIHLVKTVAYPVDNRPFEYSIARYRGDLTSFTVQLKYTDGKAPD